MRPRVKWGRGSEEWLGGGCRLRNRGFSITLDTFFFLVFVTPLKVHYKE